MREVTGTPGEAAMDPSQPNKVEFASSAWFEAIEDIMKRCLEGVNLGNKTITISEEFTAPPSHLLRPGERTIGWHFQIADEGVTVSRWPVADADLSSTVDYADALPVARLIYENTPEGIEETRKLREAAERSGHRQGDIASLPPDLLQRLFLVHNEIAIRTS